MAFTLSLRPTGNIHFTATTDNGNNKYGNIVATPDSGYQIDSNQSNYIAYPNANNVSQTVRGTLQQDGTMLFIIPNTTTEAAASPTSTVIVRVGTIAAARNLTVIENLQNCNLSGLPSAVTDQTALNLTITANSGYEFNTAPVLTFNQIVVDPNGNGKREENFTVSNDKLSATLQIDLSQYNLNYIELCDTLTITATAENDIKSVSITQNLNNCTSNAPTNITGDMTTVNIICTANNNYEFNTAPTIIFYNSNNVALHSFTFNVLASKLSANVTFDVSQFNDFEDVESIVLTATAAVIPQTVTVTVNAQNCTVNGVPPTVYTDTVLNLIANANNNYAFDSETPPQVYILDANGNPHFVYFTLSENDTEATATVNLGDYSLNSFSSVTITANAAAVTPYVDKYGTINVYKVTIQNLTDFAAVRFKKEKDTPSDTSGYFQLVDLGDYVVSVKRFYCLISDVLTAYIKAGNYNTNIQTETPQNDNFVIDCGTVAIPMQNNSITDYQNTDIKIFLPFVGFVGVPSDYVGKTIALVYRVNIVNGDCVAVLSCNGIDFDFVQCTISNDVIFKTNKENKFSGNNEFNLQVLKGLQPYVIVKTFTDENKQIYNSDCVRLPLSEITGYFAANEIENFVNDTITETETEILYNEIANGVFILTV
jgi:hypothetical protein